MAHEKSERYSKLVLAKLRKELVLKDGVVFNTDYEGDPKAGAVKIPVRDNEVAVSDYDIANGITATVGSTTYVTVPINHDVAVNEIIDGYDAAAVPDNLVADRLDSAAYSLAAKIDDEAASVLLAGSTATGIASLSESNIYAEIVNLRTALSKDNIPANGRFLLVTPDTLALLLKCNEFIAASALGDEVKESGVIGRVAGFNVIEWNDSTANLAMVAGHPMFATRVREFSVPVGVTDLKGSGKYIGASAVQGRMVFMHKVTRSKGIRAAYTPAVLGLTAAAASTSGKTVVTVAGASGSCKYTVNPTTRAAFGATYGGTAITSGSTQIAASAGDVIEVVELDGSTVKAVGYKVLEASEIKA